MDERGSIRKSRDGIPRAIAPPPGIDLAREARTARTRFYPVTIAYTAYALVILPLGLKAAPRTAGAFIAASAFCWTLVEYLVHRHVLHGRFPDGRGAIKHWLHLFFDRAHGDHHQRPWDGMFINGRYDSAPFAILFALLSFLAPLPRWPVFVATLLQCYVIEEWVHYSVHFHNFRSRYFVYIRKHHLYHHSARGSELAFGLTSGIWDAPLGTRIPAEDRAILYRGRGGQREPRPESGPTAVGSPGRWAPATTTTTTKSATRTDSA